MIVPDIGQSSLCPKTLIYFYPITLMLKNHRIANVWQLGLLKSLNLYQITTKINKYTHVYVSMCEWDLTTSNDVEVLGQDVDEFAFAFVAPLRAQHARYLTQRRDPARRSLGAGGRLGHAQRRRGRHGGANDEVRAARRNGPALGPQEGPPWARDGLGVDCEGREVHGDSADADREIESETREKKRIQKREKKKRGLLKETKATRRWRYLECVGCTPTQYSELGQSASGKVVGFKLWNSNALCCLSHLSHECHDWIGFFSVWSTSPI